MLDSIYGRSWIFPEQLESIGIRYSGVYLKDRRREISLLLEQEGGDVTVHKVLTGHWQPAYLHKCTNEICIVLSGFVVHAVYEGEGEYMLHKYEAGENFECSAGISHAIYASSRSCLIAVKVSVAGPEPSDCSSVPELDKLLRALPEEIPRDMFDVFLRGE